MLNQTDFLGLFEESDELSAADLRACVGGIDLSGISLGVSGASALVAPVFEIVPVKADLPVTKIVNNTASDAGIGLPNVSVS